VRGFITAFLLMTLAGAVAVRCRPRGEPVERTPVSSAPHPDLPDAGRLCTAAPRGYHELGPKITLGRSIGRNRIECAVACRHCGTEGIAAIDALTAVWAQH
jgi:hypothetical protein